MHRPNNQRLSSWATNYTWARLSMNSYYSSSCGKQFLDHKSINRDFQKNMKVVDGLIDDSDCCLQGHVSLQEESRGRKFAS